MQAAPEGVHLRLDWADAYTLPALHANQALSLIGAPVKGVPDGIYLVLGNVEPMVIVDERDRERLIEELTANGLKVKAQGRFHLSRETALEVIRVLEIATAQYEAAVDAAASAEPGA